MRPHCPHYQLQQFRLLRQQSCQHIARCCLQHLLAFADGAARGTAFPCFTSITVQIKFDCFTIRKVQILTPEELLESQKRLEIEGEMKAHIAQEVQRLLSLQQHLSLLALLGQTYKY